MMDIGTNWQSGNNPMEHFEPKREKNAIKAIKSPFFERVQVRVNILRRVYTRPHFLGSDFLKI